MDKKSYKPLLRPGYSVLPFPKFTVCFTVQFVEMRRFLRLAADGTEEIRWNKLGLAKEVLAELPSQVMT